MVSRKGKKQFHPNRPLNLQFFLNLDNSKRNLKKEYAKPKNT